MPRKGISEQCYWEWFSAESTYSKEQWHLKSGDYEELNLFRFSDSKQEIVLRDPLLPFILMGYEVFNWFLFTCQITDS